eukprot:1134812-Amphidinium_carterae.1
MTTSPAFFQSKKRELRSNKLRKKCSISGGEPLRIRQLPSHLRDMVPKICSTISKKSESMNGS